jgi:hypothetical protein
MKELRLAVVSGLMLAGCAATEVAPPVVRAPIASHTAARPAALDWFQQQIVAARVAQRSHLPKSDHQGAQEAYDQVMRAACGRVELSGPDKYKPRCDSLLQHKPPLLQSDPFACEQETDNPADIVACND